MTWFDYLWLSGESTVDEAATLGQLPESIRAEIAMNVHADALRRVAIFRECETGLLTHPRHSQPSRDNIETFLFAD